jgi:hypothetical protein
LTKLNGKSMIWGSAATFADEAGHWMAGVAAIRPAVQSDAHNSQPEAIREGDIHEKNL